MTALIITAVIAFFIGALNGFLAAAILSAANSADDYDPMEHEPPPRVMPQIWDGFNGEKHR